MSDEDFSTGGGGKGSGPGKHRGPRFTWNPQVEATFFQSLCESVSLGMRDGSTFKPEAWERATQALINRHSAYANKGHLINKTDNARKKYRLWRGLREDPEFLYNAQTRSVSATDDAWQRHLVKEPLARSLRARPFEHEEYYEILFPDVIGSGGAPKRLTKPRRKGRDSLSGTEEPDAPGTAIMDLLADPAYINPSQTHIPPPLPPAAMSAPMHTHPPQAQQHARPQAASMPPPPPRSTVSSTSALTPPEETGMQTRKRLQAPDSNPTSAPDKRRRTAPPGYLDLTQQQQQQQAAQQAHQAHQNPNPTSAPQQLTLTNGTNPATPSPGITPPLSLSDGILLLTEALRTPYSKKGTHTWQEQAMDIFFHDFATEDMDLQLKIAEKVLADENKAMVFCKMPDALRRHWVKRLREVHNRIA